MKTRLNTPLKSFLLLALGLAGCLSLLALRMILTHHLSYSFLAWNLGLGLIPLAIALLALFTERQNWGGWGRVLLVGLSLAWLVFFPNSSYIFTDFIHLIKRGLGEENPNARGFANMLIWYDVITRSLFAFVGHFMGLASLFVMHNLWKKEWGWAWGWLLVGFSCLAAGYGVFIGRFERWSSWHLFTHPGQTARSLLENLTMPDAWLFSVGFGLFLAFSYFFVYVFKKHLFVPKES